jgi:CheY-specific phosphatase CheX
VNIKFFGQFLLERGEIDAVGLRSALDLMEQENQTIGELAVEEDFATPAECRRVHGEQRRRDLPWGELAVQMGVLNNIELEELLQTQRRTRLPLAGALVRMEVLSADRVRALHDEFKSEHGEISTKPTLPAPLAKNRVAEATSDLFARLLRRVAGIEASIGHGRELDALPQGVLVAAVQVVGTRGLRATLLVDQSFGERLAAGLLGLELEELASELALEAVGEFLNMLAGNVVSILEEEALELRLEPPCYGVLPSSGYQFEIETEATGSAMLILELTS